MNTARLPQTATIYFPLPPSLEFRTGKGVFFQGAQEEEKTFESQQEPYKKTQETRQTPTTATQQHENHSESSGIVDTTLNNPPTQLHPWTAPARSGFFFALTT